MDKKLFQLNGEQMAILCQIREKLDEFRAAGGYLYAVDYDDMFYAVNSLGVEDVTLRYEDEREDYEQDGYIAMNGAKQTAPFSIPIVSEYFDLVVKPKHVLKNLF